VRTLKAPRSQPRERPTGLPAVKGGGTKIGGVMFMILFILLTMAWLLGSILFDVSSLFIHIPLVVGVISLIMHFVRGQGGST